MHDHGWLRILDLRQALTARTYGATLDTVVRVEDALGFTEGTWRLRVDGAGAATIDAAEGADPEISLDVSALSALYAGGVRAAALHGAGRIVAAPPTLDALDRAFATFPAPSLDIWY